MVNNTNRDSQPPLTRDIFGYNAAIADQELLFATSRCTYALDRRDRVQERVRFGSLALNAATLVSLISASDRSSQNLLSLGVTHDVITTSCILFIIGMIQAALAIWVAGNHFVKIAAAEVETVYRARNKRALFDAHFTPDIDKKITEALQQGESEMGDFKYSKLEIFLTIGSGSTWLVGIGAMLLSMIQKSLYAICA